MGGRQGRQWLARALGLALLLQLVFAPAPAHALSWRLPGRGAAPSSRPASEHAKRQLREVAPPAWVQQARLALEDRDPTVRILAPADGDLLPDGPWTLRLQVSDWPLVDGGPLGLGPHLVVQLDGEPPRPTVDTEVEMPALSPGSHRLTVYAAKPWGEAHKSPLALRQIRLHRLAPHPATLPAPGTPQLIPVSPAGLAGDPPLLLDWLLIDAPLRGLRGDGSGWRLRLTVNGESVLVDQQTPLWLQGWKPGSNALLLELLDGRGEPLNPPFNSLLREVIVPSAAAGAPAPAHAAPLTELELAVLLGEQPVSALTPAPPEKPAPIPLPASPPRPAPDSPASTPTTKSIVSASQGGPDSGGTPAAPASPPAPNAEAPSALSPATTPGDPLSRPDLAPRPQAQAPNPPDPAPADPEQELEGGSASASAPEGLEAAALDRATETPQAAKTADPVPAGPTSPPNASAPALPAAALPSGSDSLSLGEPPSLSPAPSVSDSLSALDSRSGPDSPSGSDASSGSVSPQPPELAEPRQDSPPPPGPAPAPPPPSKDPAASAPAPAARPAAGLPAPAGAATPAAPVPAEAPASGGAEATAAPVAGRPARAELNADATPRRASDPTPLQRLRERLGR